MTSVPSVSRLGPVFREAHAAMAASAAVIEADACLQCGGPCAAAPCVGACPTGIDIPGFIKDIAEGRPGDAAAKIFADNILGGTCSRVCPVEVLCEGSCVLLKEGRRAIHIARLQRHATDHAIEAGTALPQAAPPSGRTAAVIGAGPAGLACAAELARAGHAVTVYESREFPGGLVTRSIAPYKQQYRPLPEEVERIRGLGVDLRFGVTVGKDITAEQLRERHDAVFLGVGMGDDMPARLPGEDLQGVWESLRFIEEIKLGAGAAGPSIGTRVVVIGGGNTAIDVAREAVMLKTTETAGGNTAVDVARQSVMLGASEVVMLYRRSEAEMPAFAHEIAAARREGVRIQPLAAPVEFIGEGGRLRGVKCIRMKLGAPDSSGRPRPEPIPGSEFTIEADTAVKAIGQKPRKELLDLFGVEMRGSVVKVDETLCTSVPGVFAGGDCINGGSTVVEAVRDGRNAGRAIDRVLRGCGQPQAKTDPAIRIESDDGLLKHYQEDFRLTTAPRLCKGCNVCVTGCPTSTLGLDSGNRIVVKDAATCVFCGLCEARCPDFAIWIVRGEAQRSRAASKVGVTA